MSLNSTHGEVYSIQQYVIKFVSDLQQVGGFLWVHLFPPPRYNWNIVESGLKHHKPNLNNSSFFSHFRYDEERHNCFDFVLDFLQSCDIQELMSVVQNKLTLCQDLVIKHTHRAAAYISLYRNIQQNGFSVQNVTSNPNKWNSHLNIRKNCQNQTLLEDFCLNIAGNSSKYLLCSYATSLVTEANYAFLHFCYTTCYIF